MKFKEFIDLTETGTSTADIAGFSRICIPLVRRMYPNEIDIGFGKNTKRTKVTYKVPQLDEISSNQNGTERRGCQCPYRCRKQNCLCRD
jgi:hypothetical protein